MWLRRVWGAQSRSVTGRDTGNLAAFASLGFTPLSHEVIDDRCLLVRWSEETGAAVDEITGPSAEGVLSIRGRIGSFSYDEWEMLACDILVPDSILGEETRAVSLPGTSEQQRVCDAARTLGEVKSNRDMFSHADYLIEMIEIAIEKKILFTVAA